MTPQEKRSHPRTPVTLLVQHRSSADGPEAFDYVSDLSPGGLFIRTTEPATVGSTLQLQFFPKRTAQAVQAFCKVARVTRDGIAAQFIQMDEASKALLLQCLPHANA